MKKKKNKKTKKTKKMNFKISKEDKKNTFKIYSPEDKSKLTTRNTMIGRITIKQYAFLVLNGFNGEKIKDWTKYHAHKEISKIIDNKKIKHSNINKEG